MPHHHLVTVEGSDHGPYLALGPAQLTGYDTLTVTFTTAQQIAADLTGDASGLTAQWVGRTLHFSADAGYNTAAFSLTVPANADGHYVIPSMWPWEHWNDEEREQRSDQRAYALGATGLPLEEGAPSQDRDAWLRGRDDALALRPPPVQQKPLLPARAGRRATPHR